MTKKTFVTQAELKSAWAEFIYARTMFRVARRSCADALAESKRRGEIYRKLLKRARVRRKEKSK